MSTTLIIITCSKLRALNRLLEILRSANEQESVDEVNQIKTEFKQSSGEGFLSIKEHI